MGTRVGRKVTLVVAAALAAALGGSGAVAAPAQGPRADDAHVRDVSTRASDAAFVPGELLVKFKSGVPAADRAAALRAHGARVDRALALQNLFVAKLDAGRGVRAAAAALGRRDDVEYAEPNWILRSLATPNDPRFTDGDLWGLHQANDVDIDAPEAWNVTTGSANIVVGVVDTGVAWQHPDLAANIWTNPDEIAGNGVDDDANGKVDDVRGWDFLNGDNDPYDDNEHGTHVAGTIGAVGNNGVGVVGVNWNVKIMPLKFLGADGNGTTSAAVEAIIYARDEGAKVVNNSWGGGPFSQPLQDAFANSPNVLFVNAAGNGGAEGVGDNNDSVPTYPCNNPVANIICVAAIDKTDALASFSNFGATQVDIGAPGVEILSTVPGFGPPNLFETWETDIAGRWTPGGTPNTWARTTAAKVSGTWSATDSPAGNYPNLSENWIQTGPINLVAQTNCVLSYALRLGVHASDVFFVDASADGTNWTMIDGWVGTTSGAFFRPVVALGGFSGSNVFLRFGVASDEALTGDGAYVDDVQVSCAEPTAANYDVFQGTSMASPHVAGVAALALAKNESATVAQVKAAILNSADPTPSLNGKVVTGGRVDAIGTLALIPLPTGPRLLTVSKAGAGSGTVTCSPAGIVCGVDCTESYPHGTTVTLTAVAPAGSRLGGWTGCTTQNGVTCTVDMTSAHAVTVTFLPGTFTDVPTTHPFFTHIEQMFARGITNGCFFDPATGERRYCPLAQVTRQEMAVFVIRALGDSLLTPATPTFGDVPADHMFYGHIERFFEKGITNGCAVLPVRMFCPLANVTRQEMAVFIVRAKGLGLLSPATPTFVDVPSDHVFYGHIERFFEQGITNGCAVLPERRFCPLDNVTREAMAAFMIRAFPAP